MLIEQMIEFDLRGAWAPGVHVLLQLVIFMTKQQSQRKIFDWIIIYGKYFPEGNIPYFAPEL